MIIKAGQSTALCRAPAIAIRWSAAGVLAFLTLPFVVLIAIIAMFGSDYPDFGEE